MRERITNPFGGVREGERGPSRSLRNPFATFANPLRSLRLRKIYLTAEDAKKARRSRREFPSVAATRWRARSCVGRRALTISSSRACARGSVSRACRCSQTLRPALRPGLAGRAFRISRRRRRASLLARRLLTRRLLPWCLLMRRLLSRCFLSRCLLAWRFTMRRLLSRRLAARRLARRGRFGPVDGLLPSGRGARGVVGHSRLRSVDRLALRS